jgi:hypothetical protein
MRTSVVAVAGLLVTAPAAASPTPPVVPARAQHAIKQQLSPLYAFVPTRLPPGYRYANWMHARRLPTHLTIWFTWHRSRYPGLGFNVSADRCPPVHAMKTYRFGRSIVHWSTTYTDADAWRCVTRGGRRFLFYASAPGYGLTGGPASLALARVIGLARPLR